MTKTRMVFIAALGAIAGVTIGGGLFVLIEVILSGVPL
jgi:hypothetical protein